MTSFSASSCQRTRAQRQTISINRTALARLVEPHEFIALESCDDEEGFPFWLAKAQGPATRYTGHAKTVDGVKFVNGGWYIKLQYYERFPPSSTDTFRLSPKVWTENAEGVIHRQVPVNVVPGRVTRSSTGIGHIVSLTEDTLATLGDCPSLG